MPEHDLTADPKLQDWLRRGADHIEANTCPHCGSKALAQVNQTVKCCNCGKQWQVGDATLPA
jgi:uncharacterized Zn finger protein (UPF0148 family)